eukprot:scaffold659_cov192-Ochromonas_danica.AAC.29
MRMKSTMFWVLSCTFLFLFLTHAFIPPTLNCLNTHQPVSSSLQRRKWKSETTTTTTIPSCNRSRQSVSSSSATRLYLDIFGLGPSEILIIAGAGLLLYGPAKVKEQLRGSGVKGQIVSKGWIYDRKERIEEMKKYATKRRSQRALEFINQAIEEGDEEVLKKMEEFEDIFGQSDNNNEKTTTVVTKKK